MIESFLSHPLDVPPKAGYNVPMNETMIHLPSRLDVLLAFIEEDGCGLSWSPYREACSQYSVHGLDMPDDLAAFYIHGIVTRWRQEGCELPEDLPNRDWYISL